MSIKREIRRVCVERDAMVEEVVGDELVAAVMYYLYRCVHFVCWNW